MSLHVRTLVSCAALVVRVLSVPYGARMPQSHGQRAAHCLAAVSRPMQDCMSNLLLCLQHIGASTTKR